MPRVCTVCTHPKRRELERALLAGEAYRHIASRFATSTAALQRHKADHLPSHVAKAHEANQVANADDLLAQLKGLRDMAISLLTKAESAGDYRTALAGIREARGCIETLMEIENELERRNVVTITVHPEWLALRAIILAALAPYPEARQQVAACLTMTGEGRIDGAS